MPDGASGASSPSPQRPEVVADAIALIEGSGALDACEAQASELVESAWSRLAPLLEDSQSKVMLRAFGWYVLERHY